MLNIAFKEWSVVDSALGAGEQTILIRKGGIHEKHGRFEVEHDRFLIYPTHLHQSAEMLKEPWRSRCVDDRTPATSHAGMSTLTIRHFVTIEEVFLAPPEESMSRWDELHIYSPELIRARYRYKPERALYVLLVRAYRLNAPQSIIETPAYAGCRSWVTLTEAIDTSRAVPVLSDSRFAANAKDAKETLTI
jgi:hypothetical protein